MRVLTVFTLLLVSVTQGQSPSPIDPSVPGACDVCIECAQCAECSQCDACSDCAPCSVCAGREEEDECEVCKPCSACNFCSECAQCDACSQCAPCLELSSASSDSDDAGDTDDAAETEAAKMGSGYAIFSPRLPLSPPYDTKPRPPMVTPMHGVVHTRCSMYASERFPARRARESKANPLRWAAAGRSPPAPRRAPRIPLWLRSPTSGEPRGTSRDEMFDVSRR